jgi:hypothetical protein
LPYSTSVLLHRDRPKYGLLLKLVLLIPVALLVAGVYLWLSGDTAGGVALLPQAFIMGLIYWLIFPREYQVYEDHLRIVLGGPFSVKVSFANVKTIRIATGQIGLTVNFVTRITRSYVEVVKKRGWSITITPTDSDSFVENANRALNRWLKDRSQTWMP